MKILEETKLKNIVIVSKVIFGARPKPFGMDGGLNIFKKSLSETFKENLNKKLKEKNMNYEASVDFTYDSLKNLIKDGASLLLLSPYIKEIVNTSNINKNDYYILSEKEFINGYVENIISYLEELDSKGL